MTLERIYLRLPIFLQNLCCTLEGLRIQQKRYGGGFERKLTDALRRAWFSPSQMDEYRDQRLRSFVVHAASTVPFYRRWFADSKVKPDDVHVLADLRNLPIITKSMVQEHPADFVSDAAANYVCKRVHTSGTTGAGLQFMQTQDAVEEQWAVWWRYRMWHGLRPGTWCAYFGGRSLVPVEQSVPPFWRVNHPGKQLFFSAYHMTAKNLPIYAAKLRKEKIAWIHGYPSLLALLAGYIAETGFDLGYSPTWVTTGAENLLPHQAALIQRAFGVRPIQHYGLAEAVANISECERGGLHVDEDFAAVEFTNATDGTSRVLGTNFSNLATPLLRYDAQDRVHLAGGSCRCGRPGRLVQSIDGRQEDYVVLSNGARLGRLDHIFKDMVHVREAQVSQSEPGKLEVLIARGLQYTDADERALQKEFAQRVGREAVVQFRYVEEVPRTAAGKLRFVVSRLPSGELTGVAR